MRDNDVVSELAHTLRDLPGVEMLLNVGLKRNSAKDKIDLLAGCNGGNIYKYASIIESLLKDRWPTGNFLVCDDSVRFNLPTGTGGVAIYDSTLLVRRIEEWVKGKNLGGQHRPWATGYWLPEALCGDIATAEILHDAKKISARILALVIPYPPTLSRSVIDLCIDEIKQKIQTLKRLIENDSPIEFGLCISDLTASMVRLVFARSRRYFRGFGSLDEQAKLLVSSDLPIYGLAIELSKMKRVRILVGEIEKLL
jgi:hypothetical protein